MGNYNQIYKEDQNIWGESPNKTLSLIYKNFKPESYFLDLGCGQGRDALFMAKNGFKVVAVDLSQVGIKQIQEIIEQNDLKNIQVINSNVLDFQIEDNKYDFINCINVLQFLIKHKALNLIKDIQQKVKLNGYIILSSFTTNDPSYKLSTEKTKILTYFQPQEMLNLFIQDNKNFKVIYYLENTILDKGHTGFPEPHKHGVVKIIGQKI